MDTTIVCGSPDVYASFPGIIRTESQLIAAYAHQPMDRLRAAGVHAHYQPVAEMRHAVSTDGGETWDVREGLPVLERCVHATRGGYYSRAALPDGTLVMMKRGYKPGTTETLPLKLRVEREGQVVCEHDLTDFGPIGGLHVFGIERLADGSLLAVGYWTDPHLAKRPRHNDTHPDSGTVHFLQGSPDGREWRYLSRIDNPHPFTFTEAAILELGRRLVCMIRVDFLGIPAEDQPPDANGRDGDRSGYGYYIYQSESLDGGRTWSPAFRTDIWGHPPHLLALASGRVLMVYGHRRPPFSVRAIVSDDQARTWDAGRIRTLHTFDVQGRAYDIGYPVATQMPDGRIVCLFYGYSGQDTKTPSPHGIFRTLFHEEEAV